MSRPSSTGSQQAASPVGSYVSLDEELPVLFPAIFGLQRERSIVGDPWQVDNQAIRQLSGASKRRNLPRLTSAHSRIPVTDNMGLRRSNSMINGSQRTPTRLESLSRTSKEMHIHLPNDYPVLPSITPNGNCRVASPDSFLRRMRRSSLEDADLLSLPDVRLSHAGSTENVSTSDSLILPRESTFGSTLSLNSHGSTIHSSPDLYDAMSGGTSTSMSKYLKVTSSPTNVLSEKRPASPQFDLDKSGEGQSRSGSVCGSGSRSSSPQPPKRPRTKSSGRRRQQEQEQLAKQKLEQVTKVLQGNSTYDMKGEAPSTSQVRIYISSTGRDMADELKYLQEEAFPKLREYCDNNDLDLLFIDLHSNSEGQSVEGLKELYEQEMERCKNSIGPSIMLLLGNHPGAQLLPVTLSQEVYKVIEAVMERDSPDEAQLLSCFYLKDENQQPPVYVLQKPAGCNDKSWSETQEQLGPMVQSAVYVANAQGMMTNDEFHNITDSEIQLEIHKGMLNDKKSLQSSVAFLRDLEGLMDDLENPEAAKFIKLDFKGGKKIANMESINCVQNLKQSVIPEALVENNIHTYTAWWQVNGLEPEHCQHNANYLKLLGRHFVNDTISLLNHALKQKDIGWKIIPNDVKTLHDEVVQHRNFAEHISKDFVDINSNLTQLKGMLTIERVTTPICVRGSGGCGKTMLLAKLASSIGIVMDSKSCFCVSRFIQIQTQKPSLRSLLLSLCNQIHRIYDTHTQSVFFDLQQENIYSLVIHFQELLDKVSVSNTVFSSESSSMAQPKALVIILDSLEFLGEGGQGEKTNILWWLPQLLPPHVYLILSLSDSVKFDKHQGDSFKCLTLEGMNAPQRMYFVKSLLEINYHKLSEEQSEFLHKAMNENNELSPLQISLATKYMKSWRSYDKIEDLNINFDLKDVLSKTLTEAEARFGSEFVVHICMYLLVTQRGGLSENELVEILCNNNKLKQECLLTQNVLNLKFMQFRQHMEMFLLESMCNGQIYLSWSHQTISDFALAHYASSHNPDHFRSDIVDMLMDRCNLIAAKYRTQLNNNEYIGGPKALTIPTLISRSYSLLPLHLCKGDLTKLKQKVFFDLDCLALKLWISGIDELIFDIESVKHKDDELIAICNTLKHGRMSLKHNKNESFETVLYQLSTFIASCNIKRNKKHRYMQKLQESCKDLCQDCSTSHLCPVFPYANIHQINKTHILSGADILLHVTDSDSVLVVSKNSRTHSVGVIDLETMVPIRQDGLFSSNADFDKEVQYLVISNDGTQIVIYEGNTITVQQLASGLILQQLSLEDDGENPSLKHLLLSRDATTIVMVTKDDRLNTIDVKTGEVVTRYPLEDCNQIDNGSSASHNDANKSNGAKDEEENSQDQHVTGSIDADTAADVNIDTQSFNEPETEQQEVEDSAGSVVSSSNIVMDTEYSMILCVRPSISDVKYSPDSSIIAMVEESNNKWSVVLWDSKQWEIIGRIPIQSEVCSKAVFSPDSTKLVLEVLSSDYVFLNTKDKSIERVIKGHGESESNNSNYIKSYIDKSSCQPCFSKDGSLLMARRSKSVTIFCSKSGEEKKTLQIDNTPTALHFSIDGSFAFVGDNNGLLGIYDTISGACVFRAKIGGQINFLYHQPNGAEQILYSITSDGSLDAWGLSMVLESVMAERLRFLSLSGTGMMWHHSNRDKDQKRNIEFVEAYSKQDIENVLTAVFHGVQEKGSFNAEQDHICSGIFHDVQLSPDGRFIITAHREFGVQIWDITTGKHVNTIECPDVWKVCIANEGMTLVCVTFTKQLMLYSMEKDKWQLIDRLHNLSHLAMDTMCVSSDTRTLIVIRQIDFPPEDIDVYAIDLVTCHIMAHLVMKLVSLDPCRVSKMDTAISNDHSYLVTCLTCGNTPDCTVLVCDLYKEITITLPSWAQNSPTPLVTQHNKAVIPLGIHVEDFDLNDCNKEPEPSHLESNSKDSLGGLTVRKPGQLNVNNTGMLFVPNEAKLITDHVYPSPAMLGMTITEEPEMAIGSSETYEGIVINVIEDNNPSASNHVMNSNIMLGAGLLGAGLFGTVVGDHCDAQAMLGHADKNMPVISDQAPTLNFQDTAQEQLDVTFAVPEVKQQQSPKYQNQSNTTFLVKNLNEKLPEGNPQIKINPEHGEKVEEVVNDEASEIKELQKALTKALQTANSTESEPEEVNPSQDILTTSRADSPVARPISRSTSSSAILDAIEESGEYEEKTMKINEDETMKADQQLSSIIDTEIGSFENTSVDQIEKATDNTREKENQDDDSRGDVSQKKDLKEPTEHKPREQPSNGTVSEIREKQNEQQTIEQTEYEEGNDIRKDDEVKGDTDSDAQQTASNNKKSENCPEAIKSESIEDEAINDYQIDKDIGDEKQSLDNESNTDLQHNNIVDETSKDAEEAEKPIKEADQNEEKESQSQKHSQDLATANENQETCQVQEEQTQVFDVTLNSEDVDMESALDIEPHDEIEVKDADYFAESTNMFLHEEDPLHISSLPEPNLPMSTNKSKKLKKLDSLSAIAVSNPVRPSSQLSRVALPFDFDEKPPDSLENPTGRRRPIGHVLRQCQLPIPEPELTTVAMASSECVVGTHLGNLLIMDFISTTVTRALFTERVSEEEMLKVIKTERDNPNVDIEDFAFKPHKAAITHVSRSCDFHYIVASSEDNTLTLWDMDNLSFVHRLEGHTKKVMWGEISGDTSLVVSGSMDQSIRLWAVASGIQLFVLSVQRPVIQTRFTFGDLHVVACLGRPGLTNVAVLKVHRQRHKDG